MAKATAPPGRVCPCCDGPLPYGSICRACEDQLPHCPNCGDLLRVEHWQLPTGRCTTVAPAAPAPLDSNQTGQMALTLGE